VQLVGQPSEAAGCLYGQNPTHMDNVRPSPTTDKGRLRNRDLAAAKGVLAALAGPFAAKVCPAFERTNDFLDQHVLPWPVRFLTHRFVILLTIGLLIPLIVFASNTILVLSVNSYLNVMSVAVSSIVLLYTTIAEARQKQIAEMQEKRAQEDHTHVTEMHNLLLQTLLTRNEEIEELRRTLSEWQGKTYVPIRLTVPADLRALHPRGYKRFATNDLHHRWQKEVLDNPLVTTVRKRMIEPHGGNRSDLKLH
jgi:hypothetical protein